MNLSKKAKDPISYKSNEEALVSEGSFTQINKSIIIIGCSWDPVVVEKEKEKDEIEKIGKVEKVEKIDIDLSLMAFKGDKYAFSVWFGEIPTEKETKTWEKKGIKHYGDNRTGELSGFDEVITINTKILNDMDPGVDRFLVLVSKFAG